jgi:hypothetical protein
VALPQAPENCAAPAPAAPAVVPRIQDGRVMLDLRTVLPPQEPALIRRLLDELQSLVHRRPLGGGRRQRRHASTHGPPIAQPGDCQFPSAAGIHGHCSSSTTISPEAIGRSEKVMACTSSVASAGSRGGKSRSPSVLSVSASSLKQSPPGADHRAQPGSFTASSVTYSKRNKILATIGAQVQLLLHPEASS